MIPISPQVGVMLYLCVTLAIVLCLWGYDHYLSRKRKPLLAREHLCVCEYCHFAYLADIAKQISQCPQCQCYNKTTTEV